MCSHVLHGSGHSNSQGQANRKPSHHFNALFGCGGCRASVCGGGGCPCHHLLVAFPLRGGGKGSAEDGRKEEGGGVAPLVVVLVALHPIGGGVFPCFPWL